MFKVTLQDGKSFECEANESIVAGAMRNGLFLDHSCLTGRCSSCKLRVSSGQTICDIDELPISELEKSQGFILSCIRRPASDLLLEAEDLSQYGLSKPKTVPTKITKIEKLTDDIIKVTLRFPPNQKPTYIEGQYVNVIMGSLKRSYSIANTCDSQELELIIKNFDGGQMSKYWFSEAKPMDLLRLEIPKGTFFLRDNRDKKNLVFLATGTGIAPIKAILENSRIFQELTNNHRIIVLWGMKFKHEIFWQPPSEVEFIPVFSRESVNKKYVQEILLQLQLDFEDTVIYACGSNDMIQEASTLTLKCGLKSNYFYSDAFVQSS